MRRCRVCGCVEDAACVRDALVGVEVCGWVEPDLCSACVDEHEMDYGELAAGLGWEHPPRIHTDRLAVT